MATPTLSTLTMSVNSPHSHQLLKPHHHSFNNDNTNNNVSPLYFPISTTHVSKLQKFNNILIQSSSSFSSSDHSSLHDIPISNDYFDELSMESKKATIENFVYEATLVDGGAVTIRVMKEGDTDETAAATELLADSYADSKLVLCRIMSLVRWLVSKYMRERGNLIPHAAILVALYAGEVAGMVEISFDVFGTSFSLPTPIPPASSPYISNMTVTKQLRRKGLGKHLLRAAEEIISKTTEAREVYLHCRMVDTVPLNIYKKAGYKIIKTDNIFTLLKFQRRKHLMCKNLSQ